MINLVMSLINKAFSKVEKNTTVATDTTLNTKEIAFLLSTLKDTTFKVVDVEVVYTTILKLQNQYIQQTNQSQD